MASYPLLAIIVVAADGIWVATSAILLFPAALETMFHTLAEGLTIAMIFVIQHSQSRLQAATQRKLDEILKALPGASNALLSIENANDDELHRAGLSHNALRQEALVDSTASNRTATENLP